MGIASFAQYPQTREDFAVWSFSHMAHHRDIVRRVMETKRVRLDLYVLDPFDPVNSTAWSDSHQAMHTAMDKALGIPQYMLSEPDWTDPEAMQTWLSQHWTEHN